MGANGPNGGNTCLYGATGGSLFAAGRTGERFAVRNSGAVAVVEGVGDHGCEYMTGGTVVVLDPVGRNFGAGMSGGLAFVWDPADELPNCCNAEMIELLPVDAVEDRAARESLVARHAEVTGSPQARQLLARWDEAVNEFRRASPLGGFGARSAARSGPFPSAPLSPRRERAEQPRPSAGGRVPVIGP